MLAGSGAAVVLWDLSPEHPPWQGQGWHAHGLSLVLAAHVPAGAWQRGQALPTPPADHGGVRVFASHAGKGRRAREDKMKQRERGLLLSFARKAASGTVFNHRISFPGSYFATQRRICLARSELAAGS